MPFLRTILSRYKVVYKKIIENKSFFFGVRVASDEHEQITQYAAEHKKTISQVILERLEFLEKEPHSN